MMILKENLFAVVVWYNPTDANVLALSTYISQVEQLIIVDNSDKDNAYLLEDLPYSNVCYIPNYDNKGIAFALNRGCEKAIEKGAEFVLTMDQDSRFPENGVERYVELANQYPEPSLVGLFSPLHITTNIIPFTTGSYTERTAVMTSGNLLPLSIYKTMGGFAEELFIDLVDDEYCCRLHRAGYRIIQVNQAHLQHSLGDHTIQIRFLWFFKRIIHDHNPIRRYYIMRNSLEILKRYPEQQVYYKKQIKKTIKRVVLYDNNRKCTKLRYMYWGWQDFRKGVFGKFAR